MTIYKDNNLTISLLQRKSNIRVIYRYKSKSYINCYKSIIESKTEINKRL